MIAAILSGRVGFSAFQVVNEDGRVHGRVVTADLDSLSAGDVVIRAPGDLVDGVPVKASAGE